MFFNKSIICIISIIIGYSLGSILPAHFLSRIKGIDIRDKGTCNPGTTNIYHTMGLLPAIVTGIYDTLKGILAIFIAQKIGAGFHCAQIAGFLAIIGHIFPFYLQFKGGQGVACATGIMLFYLVNYLLSGIELLYPLAFLLILVLIFLYVSKTGEIIGLIVLPVFGYSLFMFYPESPYNIYVNLIIIYIWSIGIYNIEKQRILHIYNKIFRRHWWRVALRPFALIFVIFYIYSNQQSTLILIGSVTLFFIIVDITRFIHKNTNELLTVRIKAIFKRSERKRFSSMTMFLISGFITILLFSKEIAITAFIFLIFGDIFSKIFGLKFGKRRILQKTLEGSLAYLGGTFICGYILYFHLNLSILQIGLGAISATIAEVIPLGLDDNFTVALISGSVMTVVKIFGF